MNETFKNLLRKSRFYFRDYNPSPSTLDLIELPYSISPVLAVYDDFTNIQYNLWQGDQWEEDMDKWWDHNIAGDPHNGDLSSRSNIIYDSDLHALRLYTTKPGDCFVRGCISKKLPGNGVYRIVIAQDGVTDICNAFWLYWCHGQDQGCIEYDYEMLGQYPNKWWCNTHWGYGYGDGLSEHTPHNWIKNRHIDMCIRNQGIDIKNTWVDLTFVLTPFYVEWWINGFRVKRIKRNCSTKYLYCIINTGTGGIGRKNIDLSMLPAGIWVKNFTYYKFITS